MRKRRTWASHLATLATLLVFAAVAASSGVPAGGSTRRRSWEPAVFLYADRRPIPQESSVMTLKLPGTCLTLFIRKPETGSVRVADPGHGSPHLNPSPDGTKWLVEWERALYLVSEGATAIEDISPALTGGFDRLQLTDRARELGGYLAWITRPMWDASGTRVVFGSNRKAVSEGRETGFEL